MARTIQIEVKGEAGQYEATVQRIIEKNQAMSRDAVAGTQRMTAQVSVLRTGLTGLQTAFAGAFSAGAIIAFTKNVVDLAGQLGDLSERTGISTKTLSGIRTTLQEGGVSLDNFARAIQLAQRSLGEMDEDGTRASRALKAMGLNVESLIRLSPEQFLKTFADGLAKVENQNQRMAIAAAVLGREGTNLAPVLAKLAGNFDELRNSGLSEDTIRALDDMGDAFTRLGNKITDFSANALVRVLKEFGVVERSAQELQRLLEHTERFAPGDIGRIRQLERQLAEARERQDQSDLAQGRQTGALLDLEGDDKRRKAAEKAIADAKRFADQIAKQNETLALQIITMRDGEEAAAEWKLQLLEGEAASHKLTDAQRRHIAQQRELVSVLRELKDEQDRQAAVAKFLLESEAAELIVKQNARAALDAEFALKRDMLTLDLERLRAMGLEDNARKQELVSLIQLNQERKKHLDEAANRGEIFRNPGELAKIAKETDVLRAKLDVLGEHTINIGKTITGAIGDAFEGIILGTSKLADVGKNLLTAIGRNVIQFFAEAYSKKLGFENLIFSNLRGFVPQANNALMAGASAVPGGQGGGIFQTIFGGGGGGGFLSSIFGGGGRPAGVSGPLLPNGGFFSGGGSGGGGFGFGGIGDLLGGFNLGNIFSNLGIGFGSAPAGVAGPALANGGFFSSPMALLPEALGNLSGILGAIGGAYTIISSFAKGNIGGGIGGLLGGGVGAFFGGPVGFGIGSLLGSLIGGLFGSTPNPTVNVRAKLEGFIYDAIANEFKFGKITTKGTGSDISGGVVKQVTNEVQQVLEQQAKVWTDILNLFPVIVHDNMIPAIDHANTLLNEMFGKLKFSEGGSRSIAEELKYFAERTGPGRFFVASRGILGEGLAESFSRAGLGGLDELVATAFGAVPLGSSRNLNKTTFPGLNPPKNAKDTAAFVDAVSKFAAFSGSLAGISPNGIGQFLTDDDLSTVQNRIGDVLKITDGRQFTTAVDQMIERLKPVSDFLSRSVQESAGLFGRGMMAALEAATESQANRAFLQSLGEGTKNIIFQGITEAFLASAQFNDLLAPIQKTIREFTQEAIASGETPDIDAFRRAILPSIEDISTRADLLQELIAQFPKLGADIKDALRGLIGGSSGNTFNINVEKLIANDEDDVRTLAGKLDDFLRGQNNP